MDIQCYGSNYLFALGISSIFKKAASHIGALNNSLSSLTIWNFTEKLITLNGIAPLMGKISLGEPCIIFGSQHYRRIFSNIPDVKCLYFIDASVSLQDAELLIYAGMVNYCLTGRFYKYIEKDPLSEVQKSILREIINGVPQREIAKKKNLNVKSVSACKRAAMRKLNVRTNMELLIKSKIMNL